MRRFKELNLSEVRRLLSALVREIEDDPAAGYRITVRGRCVAELKAPAARQGRLSPGKAMLAAVRKMERLQPARKRGKTRLDYKEYLYGERGALYPSPNPKGLR